MAIVVAPALKPQIPEKETDPGTIFEIPLVSSTKISAKKFGPTPRLKANRFVPQKPRWPEMKVTQIHEPKKATRQRGEAQPFVHVMVGADLTRRILDAPYRSLRTARSVVTLYFHQLPLLALVPQGRENTRFQNFRLGSHPVFQFFSFHLSAFIVKLARAQAYFSLQQFHHQLSPFATSGHAVHL